MVGHWRWFFWSDLSGPLEPLRQWSERGWVWPFDWWATSRVIPDTINEYPAFTLAVGDAHAHFYALSFRGAVALPGVEPVGTKIANLRSLRKQSPHRRLEVGTSAAPFSAPPHPYHGRPGFGRLVDDKYLGRADFRFDYLASRSGKRARRFNPAEVARLDGRRGAVCDCCRERRRFISGSSNRRFRARRSIPGCPTLLFVRAVVGRLDYRWARWRFSCPPPKQTIIKPATTKRALTKLKPQKRAPTKCPLTKRAPPNRPLASAALKRAPPKRTRMTRAAIAATAPMWISARGFGVC